MRSLVADIFHSLSRNNYLASPNSSSCGPIITRISPSDRGGRSIRCSVAPLAAAVCNSSPACNEREYGLPSPRIHGQAAEHRLTGNSAFDREIAERTAAGKAQRQGLAVGQGHGCIRGDGPPRDVRIAWCASQRDTNRTFARRERRPERADFDGRGEDWAPDQAIRRGQRQSIHCPARREAITLGAVATAVLHRTRRTNGRNDEFAHEAINSATISPRSAARSCSAKVSASTAVNVTASPGSSRKVGSRCSW